MGEIIVGIIVMAIFILFVMKKGKGKKQDEFQRIQDEQYWAEKDTHEPQVESADFDSSDD